MSQQHASESQGAKSNRIFNSTGDLSDAQMETSGTIQCPRTSRQMSDALLANFGKRRERLTESGTGSGPVPIEEAAEETLREMDGAGGDKPGNASSTKSPRFTFAAKSRTGE